MSSPDAVARAGRSARNEIVVDSRSRGEERVGEPDHPGLTYRPELDALRGIAILLVMTEHGVIPSGGVAGTIGVTLFFVLSGYLITGLLVKERAATGTVSLARFYVRRARRLTPALVALVAVAVVLRWPGNPIPALGYFTNIYAALGGHDMGWLVHTWTLAREEQFYLAWPLLFLIAGRSKRLTVVMLLGFLVLSLPFGVVLTPGLMLGCLLAVVRLSALIRSVGDTILAAIPRWPLVRIGQISYGLYLWNLPVAQIMLTVIPGNLALRIVATVGGTFALALASERWIERPFRVRGGGPVLDLDDAADPDLIAGGPCHWHAVRHGHTALGNDRANLRSRCRDKRHRQLVIGTGVENPRREQLEPTGYGSDAWKRELEVTAGAERRR